MLTAGAKFSSSLFSGNITNSTIHWSTIVGISAVQSAEIFARDVSVELGSASIRSSKLLTKGSKSHT